MIPTGKRINKELTTINGQTFLVCADCRLPMGRQPGYPSLWAAYDDPGELVFAPNGKPVMCKDFLGRDAQQMVSVDQDISLCSECYLKRFKKRYPEAAPPTHLYDSRLPNAQPVVR